MQKSIPGAPQAREILLAAVPQNNFAAENKNLKKGDKKMDKMIENCIDCPLDNTCPRDVLSCKFAPIAKIFYDKLTDSYLIKTDNFVYVLETLFNPHFRVRVSVSDKTLHWFSTLAEAILWCLG